MYIAGRWRGSGGHLGFDAGHDTAGCTLHLKKTSWMIMLESRRSLHSMGIVQKQKKKKKKKEKILDATLTKRYFYVLCDANYMHFNALEPNWKEKPA